MKFYQCSQSLKRRTPLSRYSPTSVPTLLPVSHLGRCRTIIISKLRRERHILARMNQLYYGDNLNVLRVLKPTGSLYLQQI